MTLITGFFKDGCPILMGDLLLSAQDNPNTEIVLPTIGNISKKHLSKGEYRPTSLCQKINLLSPKLAIAWSGNCIYASDFIQGIIDENLHDKPSRDSLRGIYNRISGHGDLSVISIFRDGKEMCIFDLGAYTVKPPDQGFKWFKAAGSGYKTFLDIVPSLVETRVTSGQPNKLDRGISTAVFLSTELLSQEILASLPLQNLFGAGYEILHPLAKFCDLTYLFWKAEGEAQERWKLLPFPFLASNYSYHGDILVIRSVRVSSNIHAGSCKIDSDELHVISPIHRSVREEELIDYVPSSLNSKWICNIFLCKDHLGNMGMFATFGHYATQGPPIIWRNEFNNKGGIDINKKFLESSVSKIAVRMANDHGTTGSSLKLHHE